MGGIYWALAWVGSVLWTRNCLCYCKIFDFMPTLRCSAPNSQMVVVVVVVVVVVWNRSVFDIK